MNQKLPTEPVLEEEETDEDTQTMNADEKNTSTRELEEELKQAKTDHLRALADYQNLLKQTQRERREYIQFATGNLLREFIPIIENLERAAQHLQDEGVKMVLKQMHQLLEQAGVEVIRPEIGAVFDPSTSECVEVIFAINQPDNTIIEIIRPGYRWTNGPIINHAQVKVYRIAEQEKDLS